MAKYCIDCGCKLTSRRKTALRCHDCKVRWIKSQSTGRKTGVCECCGKKLSQAKSVTNKCQVCFLKTKEPWNKGIKGTVPWNKGKSLFETKEQAKNHSNKIRKISRKNNLTQCFADRVRTLIRNSLRKASARKINTKTSELLGCDIVFFIKYIESKFEKGMTWDNYGNGHGRWNIDHIDPMSSFDLLDLAEQRKACHYSNCRPMWAIDNIKKGAKKLKNKKPEQIVLPISAAVLTTAVTY